MEMNNEGPYLHERKIPVRDCTTGEIVDCVVIPERGKTPPNTQQSGNNTPNGNKLSGSDGSEYYDIILPCGTKVSCNDVIDALGMNFNTGEAFKGLWRKGRKPTVPASYDLSKTVYYASRELKREEQNEI